MADKTIALKIAIQGNPELKQLQANFDNTRKELQKLNKLEKENKITSEQASKARAGLNVELKANRNALTDQQNALLKNNDALKKNSGFVAGVKKGVGQWATSMIGVTAAIAGVSAVINNVLKTIKQFDQDMANLKAITGSTDEQMKGFKQSVLDVSQATGKGASEIAQAFQLVGSAKPELLSSAEALGEVTKQAVLLSQAGGMEVPEAAAALTKAMNQFGASAEDAGMFTDILATSQQKGTATIAQLSESLKNAGANANAAGLSFEETNVVLQALAKGGLVGAEAGTGLSSTLIKLSTQADDKINPSLTSMKDVVNELAGRNLDLAGASKLVGAESAKTLLTLIDQKDVVNSLTGQLNEYENAAKQAATVTETIAGKQEALGSQWERFVLSMDEGSSVIGNAYRAVLDFATNALKGFENLDLVVKNLFGGLSDFTEDELKRTLKGGWETEFGLSIDTITKKFDKIPFDQLKGNIKDVGETWVKLLGEDSEDAMKLFEQYVKNRITKEKELKKQLTDPTTEITTTDEDTGGNTGTSLTKEQEKAAEERAKLAEKERQKDLEREEQRKEDEFIRFLENQERQKEFALLNQERLQLELDEENRLRREARIADANSILENEQLVVDARKKYAEENKKINEAVAFSFGGLALAIASSMGDSKEAQAAALAIDKLMAIARVVIATQTSNATITAEGAALAIPTAGASVAAAAGLVAKNNIVAGLNIATIMATAIPQISKFADGGILSGASHANGGIPFTINGQSGFEAEGGEAIINKRSTAMFTPLLSAINEAGGGNRLFADGGLVPNTGGLNSSQSLLQSANNQGDLAEIIASSIGSIEVVNVATNTSDVATEVTNISNNATF